MRRVLILGTSLALLAPVARAAEKKEKEKKKSGSLTAAQIVEKSVKARGGLERWRAVLTMKIVGEIDAGGKEDPMLPFVLLQKRPQKSRLEITFAGKNAVQVFDGKQGWKLRPFLNRDDVEPFTPAELKSAASAAPLDGFLVDYEQKGARVDLAGTERIEKKKNYKLKLTLKDGQQRFVWIDANTWLETKISGETRKMDKRPHKVEVFSRDWRTVDGLKVPFVIETRVAGVKQTHKMVARSITLNPALDDAIFTKPTIAVARAAGR